ncbi:hypothetical protein SAMN04488563_5834 [Jiangella alkaliphila]|uniref:Uncharacterized protein n=1 Tax=Jiangella alkaliphila TaxID=419479 RepID=A0A1H2LCL4_9ACTN|nr:hypothetical protein SAMN04488563_5834 [Jiangella alkaliphila]
MTPADAPVPWAEIDAAYVRLRADPEQWSDYLAELAAWEVGGRPDPAAAGE